MRRRRGETGAASCAAAPAAQRGAGATLPLRRAWWQVINHKTAPRRERRCFVCGGGVRQRDGGATGASTRSGWC